MPAAIHRHDAGVCLQDAGTWTRRGGQAAGVERAHHRPRASRERQTRLVLRYEL